MKVVVDIETNSLDNPDKVWIIVCKDIDTNEFHIFRRVSDDATEAQRFRDFASHVDGWIGHNLLGFDAIHLNRLGLGCIQVDRCFDTLVASKLHDYSRDGHSIEAYGLEYGIPKGDFKDFSRYSKEMEDYCVRDVEICHHLYGNLLPSFRGRAHFRCLAMEQEFQSSVVNALHSNGFGFNRSRAESLLDKVTSELSKLDEAIHEAFPHRLKCIREISPVLTQHGTLHRKDFRWVQDGDLSDYNGGPFCRCAWTKFNPSSHKQVIEVLHQAGWKPVDRTKTYIEKRREEARSKIKTSNEPLDIDKDSRYSWKINETNLQTLPANAPPPARALARRILLESRRRTLTEWLHLCGDDGRIHGKFHGIGAWTHRMAHQSPNTANIPNSTDTQGKLRLYGAEMRALWCAPRNRLLVGVDAEGIQLRIFAHLINDKEFTHALVNGRKEDKSDPHSLNQRIIGRVCKSRSAAKRFIYALLLGAGTGKLSEILECTRDQTEEALNRLLDRYRGWATLKEKNILQDSQRGYFYGLDGRKVQIYGATPSERRHLAMSGYLQNGEAVVMKTATLLWLPRVLAVDPTAMLVNLVHDEWQTEVSNDIMLARQVAEIQADSLREVGEMFGLNCPLSGSYYNDDLKDYTIGTNWRVTH